MYVNYVLPFSRTAYLDAGHVLQTLLSSGAHLSRYLIQVSMHHYFYTQSHFIKTPWVRKLPFDVFIHFLQRAEERYGEIPRGKVSLCCYQDLPSSFLSFVLVERR
jgi:hypothetical protein